MRNLWIRIGFGALFVFGAGMFFIAVDMMFLRRAAPASYAMNPTWISHMMTTVQK